MSRRIRTTATQSTGGRDIDGFFDRVLKYIPADVVGAWVAATGIIASAAADGASGSGTVLWIAFAFGLVVTALWTFRQTSETGRPAATQQIGVSTVAFAVWVFALGGPFATLGWYQQYQGSLLLIGFTLLAGLIVPRDE